MGFQGASQGAEQRGQPVWYYQTAGRQCAWLHQPVGHQIGQPIPQAGHGNDDWQFQWPWYTLGGGGRVNHRHLAGPSPTLKMWSNRKGNNGEGYQNSRGRHGREEQRLEWTRRRGRMARDTVSRKLRGTPEAVKRQESGDNEGRLSLSWGIKGAVATCPQLQLAQERARRCSPGTSTLSLGDTGEVLVVQGMAYILIVHTSGCISDNTPPCLGHPWPWKGHERGDINPEGVQGETLHPVFLMT